MYKYFSQKLPVYNIFIMIYFNFSIKKLDEIHRFDDWIITLNWLGPTSDLTLTILFAHNNVYQYNLRTKQFSNTICRETCLLYPLNIYTLEIIIKILG